MKRRNALSPCCLLSAVCSLTLLCAVCYLSSRPAVAQDAAKDPPAGEAIKENAANLPASKGNLRKRPINLIDLPAGYTLLRNPKNLAPRSYLYVDFAELDIERFVFSDPANPKNYTVVLLNDGENNFEKATGSAATALGMESPVKKRAPEEKFLVVTDASIANKTVRLYIPRAQRGDQLEVTMENVREIIYLDEESDGTTPAAPKDKDAAPKDGDKPKEEPKPDAKPEDAAKDAALKATAPPAPDATPPPNPATPAASDETAVRTVTRPIRLRLKNPIRVESGTSLSLRPDINFIGSQKLTNGQSKPVIQIPLQLEIPSLRQTERTNSYFRSDTTLSTNVRDVAARLNLTYGVEGNVRGTRWERLPLLKGASGVLPAYSEIRLDSTMDFKSVSLTQDNGIKRRLGRSKPDPLWDTQLRSETNAILGLNAFIEQRLRVNKKDSPRHAANFNPGVSASLTLPSYELFPLPGAARNVQLVGDARVWLLPLEKGANGKSPAYVEYAYSFGIRAPLPKSLGGDRALRVTFVSGANPTAGFLRSSTIQIQLEGLKL